MIPKLTALEEEIVRRIGNRKVRTDSFIQEICPKGNKTPSRSNLKKVISKMVEKEILVRVKPKDFYKYLIDDDDKRARFLLLKKKEKDSFLLAKTLKLLDSDSKEEQEIALRELNSNYSLELTSEQLTKIINILAAEQYWGADIGMFALSVIQSHLVKAIFPLREEIDHLVTIILRKIRDLELIKDSKDIKIGSIDLNKKNDTWIFSSCIDILGLLDSPKILTIIEGLASKKLLSRYENILFDKWTISHVISENNLKVYDLEVKFKHDKDTVKKLAELRRRAEQNLHQYKLNYEPILRALKILMKQK